MIVTVLYCQIQTKRKKSIESLKIKLKRNETMIMRMTCGELQDQYFAFDIAPQIYSQ